MIQKRSYLAFLKNINYDTNFWKALLENHTWQVIIVVALISLLIVGLGLLITVWRFAEAGRSAKFFGIEIGEDMNLKKQFAWKRLKISGTALEIHHVSICVNNLKLAREFYSKTLNLIELDRPEVFNKMFLGQWYSLPSGQELHLVLKNDNDTHYRNPTLDFKGKVPPDSHFALRLKSKDYLNLLRRLQKQDPEKKTWDDKLYDVNFGQLYILDPSNNIVEITNVGESENLGDLLI